MIKDKHGFAVYWQIKRARRDKDAGTGEAGMAEGGDGGSTSDKDLHDAEDI